MSNLLEKQSVIRVKEILKKYNDKIELITLNETARTAKDAAEALNKEVGAIVKSLLFKDIKDKYYLCLVSGDKYISIKKLYQLINCKVLKATADECKKITGFSIGGVSPVGYTNSVTKILIDENLNRYQTLYAAAGHPHVVFSINFKDLVKISNGSINNFVEQTLL